MAKKKFDIKPVLSLIAIAAFFGVILVLIKSPEIPASVKDILLILVGAQVTIVKDIFSYYFGSSEGSARKTELLTPAVPAPAASTEEPQP